MADAEVGAALPPAPPNVWVLDAADVLPPATAAFAPNPVPQTVHFVTPWALIMVHAGQRTWPLWRGMEGAWLGPNWQLLSTILHS